MVTNKSAKGRKGAVVAMIKGMQADKVIEVLQRIHKRLRPRVQEVTLDMAAGMHLIGKRCIPYAHRVVDRSHVQQLAIEAVQDIRIKHRCQAIDEENERIGQKQRAVLYTGRHLTLFPKKSRLFNDWPYGSMKWLDSIIQDRPEI